MKSSLLIAFLVICMFLESYATPIDSLALNYSVQNRDYQSYLWGESNKALVVMIHDWDGITEYENKRAEMLVALGYQVLQIDMFGKNIRPLSFEDKKKLTNELYSNRELIHKLLNAGLHAAKNSNANVNNAVAMGYCFGGTIALDWARYGVDLKGFVIFHGGLNTPENQNYQNVKGKILVFHGSADDAVTMEDFADLTKRLEAEKVHHEMIAYSGAPHAFTVFDSDRYREEADRKSWKRFVEFLEENTQSIATLK